MLLLIAIVFLVSNFFVSILLVEVQMAFSWTPAVAGSALTYVVHLFLFDWGPTLITLDLTMFILTVCSLQFLTRQCLNPRGRECWLHLVYYTPRFVASCLQLSGISFYLQILLHSLQLIWWLIQSNTSFFKLLVYYVIPHGL